MFCANWNPFSTCPLSCLLLSNGMGPEGVEHLPIVVWLCMVVMYGWLFRYDGWLKIQSPGVLYAQSINLAPQLSANLISSHTTPRCVFSSTKRDVIPGDYQASQWCIRVTHTLGSVCVNTTGREVSAKECANTAAQWVTSWVLATRLETDHWSLQQYQQHGQQKKKRRTFPKMTNCLNFYEVF